MYVHTTCLDDGLVELWEISFSHFIPNHVCLSAYAIDISFLITYLAFFGVVIFFFFDENFFVKKCYHDLFDKLFKFVHGLKHEIDLSCISILSAATNSFVVT